MKKNIISKIAFVILSVMIIGALMSYNDCVKQEEKNETLIEKAEEFVLLQIECLGHWSGVREVLNHGGNLYITDIDESEHIINWSVFDQEGNLCISAHQSYKDKYL